MRLLPEYFRAAGYYTTNNVFTDFQVDVPRTAFDDCSPTAHWRNRPDPGQPFFAAFHGMATHESQIYLDEEAFAAATAHVDDVDRHDPSRAPVPPYYPDTAVFRDSIARYADLVTEMDHWVGGILAELEEDGLAGETIVVFWSDHGRGMPRAKRWACEAGLREPLIVRWPGRIVPRTVVADLVHTMDLADRAPMQHNDYPDHLATWAELRRFAFLEAEQLGRGERRSLLTPLQRRLLAANKPAEELYDLDADPHETRNLADHPRHAADLARLRQALDTWQDRYGDLGLVDEETLLEGWRPGGRAHTTAAPAVVCTPEGLAAECPTLGSSIAWTADPPAEEQREPSPLERVAGIPIPDGRRWHLYTGPVVPEVLDADPSRVWFQAWRLGFEPSEEIAVLRDGEPR